MLTDLELTAVDMVIESGSDLEVNCTLTCIDCTLSSAHVDASMLDVSFPPSSDQVRTVLNERTLSVVFRRLYRNVSHQQVFCTLPGYDRYAHSSVIVAGLFRSLV